MTQEEEEKKKKVDGVDFSFEFRNEVPLPENVKAKLRSEAEERVRALAEGHTDVIGASVATEGLTGSTTPYRYEVRLVVYMRPEHVAAVEKQESVEGALKGALSAVERQVREVRNKLREPWKQP
jgi:ribosome-associated translation inhibitor RaiA